MKTSTLRVLVLVCLALGVAIALALLASGRPWTPPPARPVDVSLLAYSGFAHDRQGLEVLEQTVERPLFNSTRRPPSVVAEVVAEPDPFGEVKVLGLFGSGAESGAILLIDGQPQRVLYGQRAGPWVLRSVQGRKAEFIRDDGSSAELELVHLPQPDAPPPALHVPEPPADADGEEPASPEAAPARAASAAARAQARAARRQAAQLPGPTTQ